MPWYEDGNFWRDFDKLYQMCDGRIVSNNGDNTLVNVITNTRIRNGKVGVINQRWNDGGQLRELIDDPAIVHLESTRINEHEREPHVIADYCEYSTESPVYSEPSDNDEKETIPTVELNEIESHSLRSTLSRSSSLDTLANGETIAEDELYDDIELQSNEKWRHVLWSMRAIDLLFQFPNGIKLPAFTTQLWAKNPDSSKVLSTSEFLRKSRLRRVIMFVRIESKTIGKIVMKKIQPKDSAQIIIQPYFTLHTKFNFSQAIYEATAKVVRDTFRRLMRMLRVFGHGIFEDQIEGKLLTSWLQLCMRRYITKNWPMCQS